MPSTKPTVVLVHGAFHRSVCFDKIKQRLEALSYPVTTVDSPTTNGSSLTTTYKDDVEAIHQVMLPLMDEGKEIVIVGHSLGGISACASTEGESIAERATAGKKGGIRSIVFICAFALPKIGLICPEYNTPADNSWAELNADGYYICNDWAKTVLYEDLPGEEREFWFKKLRHTCPAAFFTPIHFSTAELKVPSMYLIAEKDRAISLEVQEKMIAAVPTMKAIRVPCGHSPFLSHPDETVNVIVKGAELR